MSSQIKGTGLKVLPKKSLISKAALGWFICALGALFYAYEYLLRIMPSAMEGVLRSHFGLTATGFGLLSVSYYYAYVPLQLPVGMMMDRFGPKRLLTFACALCVVGTYFFAMTNSVMVSTIGRFLVGAGSAFAFVGVLKLATIWLPENQLGMVAGMTSALGTVGAMLGDNGIASCVHAWGWQNTSLYAAFFGIGLIFFLWFGISDHTADNKSGGTIDNFKKNFIDLFIILKEKQIWINGLFGCLVYLPTTVFAELWGIPYLINAHGLSPASAGFANSVLFFGFMIGAPLMGMFSDRIGRRKLPMCYGAVGAAIVMSIIIYHPHLSQVAVYGLMFLLGMLYCVQTLVFAVGRELSPREAGGTAIAITNMIVMLGAILLQPFVGSLLDISANMHNTGAIQIAEHTSYTVADYRFAMSIIPIGIIFAAILTFFIKETYAKAPE
jgi:MFS family permease